MNSFKTYSGPGENDSSEEIAYVDIDTGSVTYSDGTVVPFEDLDPRVKDDVITIIEIEEK